MSNLVFNVLAANNDEPGWVQLLVFIIVGVFYAVSSLIKARAAAAAEKKRREAQSGQARPAGGQAKPKPRPRPQMEEFDLQALWKAFEKPAPAAPVKAHLRPQFQRPAPTAVAKPPTEPIIEKKTLLSPAAPSTEKKTLLPSAEPPVSDRLLDFSDPDDLQKAILCQEIFGQPLALRDLQ